jgi:hypothetical protein
MARSSRAFTVSPRVRGPQTRIVLTMYCTLAGGLVTTAHVPSSNAQNACCSAPPLTAEADRSYDPSEKGYHEYVVETLAGINLSRAQEQALFDRWRKGANAAPGIVPDAPDDQPLLLSRLPGTPDTNWIYIYTDEQALRYTNVTLPGHYFHPGTVVNSVVRRGRLTYLRTVGTGTTSRSLRNEILGSLFFKRSQELAVTGLPMRLGLSSSCQCAPKTCDQVGAACGAADVGCGCAADCGACENGLVCGAAAANQCGRPSGTVLCDGSCVANTCDDGRVFDAPSCSCRCAPGLEECGGSCSSPCAPGEVRDTVSCACSAACPDTVPVHWTFQFGSSGWNVVFVPGEFDSLEALMDAVVEASTSEFASSGTYLTYTPVVASLDINPVSFHIVGTGTRPWGEIYAIDGSAGFYYLVQPRCPVGYGNMHTLCEEGTNCTTLCQLVDRAKAC